MTNKQLQEKLKQYPDNYLIRDENGCEFDDVTEKIEEWEETHPGDNMEVDVKQQGYVVIY